MEMEMEFELEPKKTPTKEKRERQLANVIYVFSPGMENGIMFYDQSPSEHELVGKALGTLPNGVIWSSGEEIVQWDDKINGMWPAGIMPTPEISIGVHSDIERFIDGERGSTTIITSEENFLGIIEQLQNPTRTQDDNYKIINFNSRIIPYDEYKKNETHDNSDNKQY